MDNCCQGNEPDPPKLKSLVSSRRWPNGTAMQALDIKHDLQPALCSMRYADYTSRSKNRCDIIKVANLVWIKLEFVNIEYHVPSLFFGISNLVTLMLIKKSGLLPVGRLL